MSVMGDLIASFNARKERCEPLPLAVTLKPEDYDGALREAYDSMEVWYVPRPTWEDFLAEAGSGMVVGTVEIRRAR